MDTAMDPHLTAELQRCYTEQRRVNLLHHICILAIYRLEGYSGPGSFVQSDKMVDQLGSAEGPGLIDEDVDVEDEVLRLGDFLDALSID